MSTAAYYREEAKRCRERASAAPPGSEAAEQLLGFAVDNERIANLLEEGGDTQSPAQREPTHQQPIQQRQTKQEPEDKE
jgi:hypothetical protein